MWTSHNHFSTGLSWTFFLATTFSHRYQKVGIELHPFYLTLSKWWRPRWRRYVYRRPEVKQNILLAISYLVTSTIFPVGQPNPVPIRSDLRSSWASSCIRKRSRWASHWSVTGGVARLPWLQFRNFLRAWPRVLLKTMLLRLSAFIFLESGSESPA